MDLSISCPECGRDARIRGSGKNRIARCSHGHRIEVVDEKGGLRKAEKAEEDLQRTIDRINRQMR